MSRTHDYIWTFLILLLCSVELFGQGSLEETVRRDYEQEQLSYILDNLSDRYDISIRYNESLLPSEKYTYSFDDISMKNVLSILLNDKSLHYIEYQPDKIMIVPSEMVDVDSTLTASTTFVDESLLANVVIGGDNARTPKATLLGSIIDARDFSAVNSALVINNTTGEYFTSDGGGAFNLQIDTGRYVFQVSSISHEPYTISVHIKGSDTWEILLEPKSFLIDEVVISGSSGQQKSQETIIGIEQLSRKEIEQLGIFMGEADIVKSILSLPGVSTTGDGASGFNVRGGSIDQNLILQDGTLLFNPSHVLGFFSTFNPDIVRNTTLAKGHIPAYYGGRVSSVLDIKIKDANTETTTLNGSIGLISSKVSLENPLIKGKSSFLLSGRLSHAGWLLNEVNNPDVKNSTAAFNDVNAKYTHNLSDKTKASVSFFQSFDKFSFTDQFGYSWQNRIGQLDVRHLINNNLSLSAMTSISSLENKQFQPEGLFAFELSSGVKYNQQSFKAIWSPEKHVIRAGIESINYNMRPEQLIALNDSNTLPESVDKESGREYSIFINDRYDINDKLSLDVGLRYTLYQQVGPHTSNLYSSDAEISTSTIIGTKDFAQGSVITYSGLEPRVAVRYNLLEGFALKASYNRVNQYLQLLSNTATPTPVDIWQVSTPYIQPLIADNFSAGIAHSFKSIDYSVDVYYKKLTNTIDHRDFADLLINNNLETETLSGEGRSYGAEFSLAKKGEKFSGRLSYTFSRSLHRIYDGQASTINNGEWFSANFDQPHSVKMFLNLVVSRRDRFNLSFVYNTGRPITAPFGTYIVNGVTISNFSNRNEFRLPSYHRLDLSYTFTVNRRKSARYQSDITLAFYNLYARRNAFSVFYRQENGSPINALRLSVIGSVIPSISYNFKF